MASLTKYKSYKPSGFNWIGDVPEHWEMKRFRYCFKNGKGLSITKEDLLETGVPCVSYGEIHSKFGFKVDPEKDELLCVDEKYLETNQSSVLSDGDFVFADTSEDIEGSGNFTHLIGNHKIFAGYHTIVSRLKINAIPRYIAYFFDSVAYRTQIRSEVQGVKVYSITNKILKDTILLLPELNEQRTIANYLDYQTQKIDRLIINKKEQAEKLNELRQIEINNAVTKGLNPNAELIDSGFGWLGKIPKHWQLKRLKNLANQVSEKSTEILDDDFIVALENIESHNGKFTATASEYENNGIKFKKDNLLYNKLRPYLNKVFLADRDGICVGDIIVIECTSRLHPAFLQFRMLSDAFGSVIMSSVYGAKMPRTSWEFISSLKIGYPSIEEQTEIANHLEERTSAIEKLINNIDAQIESLQQLRKIKIYEAVTGKIKVNAYAEATA